MFLDGLTGACQADQIMLCRQHMTKFHTRVDGFACWIHACMDTQLHIVKICHQNIQIFIGSHAAAQRVFYCVKNNSKFQPHY